MNLKLLLIAGAAIITLGVGVAVSEDITLPSLGIGDVALQPWEHGFKTSHIIATRYRNPTLGYSVGFRYLSSAYDNKSDRSEVFDFFQKQGCGVIQGGGAPFSEYFVLCEDVTDQASANVKLQTLLPALDRFVGSL
jgi:hypothetical protein